MTASRNRKESKEYDYHLRKIEPRDKVCAFCKIDKNSPQFLSEGQHFRIVKNIFPYSIWDNQTVIDHLLLLPNQHTDSLALLPKDAQAEFVSVISKYEALGYSIWARAPGSIMKSIFHQHTHLIKLSGKNIKGLVYLKKPHVRFVV